jgi:dephospho-CoA kinase
MVVVGLTGAIGAGKSTLARLLADAGAEVVDVDAVGREVIAAGTPGAAAVERRFGTIDRRELAGIVFHDASARYDLEAISWPLIEAELRRRVAASSAEVLVLDMAVLPQGLGKGIYGPVITVEAPESLRIERLIGRGMSEDDARARMQSQTSEALRRELADHVVVNDQGLDHLSAVAGELMATLRAAAPRTAR